MNKHLIKISMKKLLKHLYQNTQVGKILIQPLLDLNTWYWTRVVSDEKFAKSKFKTGFGKKINLENPQTLNEKIVWLKLYDRRPIQSILADKYKVRDYIKNVIGQEFLIPLYLVTKDVEDLKPENLPDFPVIIKTNHDSNGGIMIIDKNGVSWNELRKSFKERMKKNYYYRSKEWQYKNIEPCVIVEKLLLDKHGIPPKDYKVHCLSGKATMFQVDIGRFSGNHNRNFYNQNWERQPYSWSSPKPNGKSTVPSSENVPRPSYLGEMITFSEKIAKDYPYCRVDWYEINNKLYFGEITFHTDGGNVPILPSEWDFKFGQMVELNNKSSD